MLSRAQFGLFRAATDCLLGRKLAGVLGLLDNLLGIVLLLGLLVLRLRLLVLGLSLELRLSLDILDGVGLDVGGRGCGRRLRSNLLVGDWLLGSRSNSSSAGKRGGGSRSTGSARHAVKTCGTVAVKVDAGEDERDDVKEAGEGSVSWQSPAVVGMLGYEATYNSTPPRAEAAAKQETTILSPLPKP